MRPAPDNARGPFRVAFRYGSGSQASPSGHGHVPSEVELIVPRKAPHDLAERNSCEWLPVPIFMVVACRPVALGYQLRGPRRNCCHLLFARLGSPFEDGLRLPSPIRKIMHFLSARDSVKVSVRSAGSAVVMTPYHRSFIASQVPKSPVHPSLRQVESFGSYVW
jgi:hypothetical protein